MNRIHIRYEDNNFSIGTYIDSICIKNSELSDQKEIDLDEESLKNKNLMFKSCEINELSIYTDTSIIYTKELNQKDLSDKMDFERLNSESTGLKYVIRPTSLKAQIIRDISLQPLRKRHKPRIRVCSSLREFHLHIDSEQTKHICNILTLVNINNNRGGIVKPPDLCTGKYIIHWLYLKKGLVKFNIGHFFNWKHLFIQSYFIFYL